jgi:hypothetical protein
LVEPDLSQEEAIEWAQIAAAILSHRCQYGLASSSRLRLAGALVGALRGGSWIPARWRDNIENGEHGRHETVALAWRLVELDVR